VAKVTGEVESGKGHRGGESCVMEGIGNRVHEGGGGVPRVDDGGSWLGQ